MPVRALREFLRLEASGGLILMGAAGAALVLSNSPLAGYYEAFRALPLSITLGDTGLSKPLLLWINDGLMAVFFLLVGLEVKREILEGQLSSRSQIALPAIAAIGGMAVPAVIYVAFNIGDPTALKGWAIPAATDIAFALAILALLGTRAPVSLKVFLTAVAIIDDLGAIVIIAIFYTSQLSLGSLALAGACIVTLAVLNRLRVTRITAYAIVGLVLWVCVLKSGVHATLAGVVLAFAIPLNARDEDGHSPLRHLEHLLHPWVAFAILPLFAFANAGVYLLGLSGNDFLHPVSMGIAVGLFVGKLLGVFGFTWLATRLGLCRRPEGTTWVQFFGVCALTGIGFTMSLFVGTLAFEDPEFGSRVRVGVLVGSVLSAFAGYLILRMASGSAVTNASGAASSANRA
jgi:NhaA family Na+:H+ antiporter